MPLRNTAVMIDRIEKDLINVHETERTEGVNNRDRRTDLLKQINT